MLSQGHNQSFTYFNTDFTAKYQLQSEEQKNSSERRNYFPDKRTLSKIVMAGMSIPAGYFYWNYAEECQLNTLCVSPISYLPVDSQFYTFLISGAIGFSATATILGWQATDAMINTWKEFESGSGKCSFATYQTAFVTFYVLQVAFGVLGSINNFNEITNKENLISLTLPSLAVIPSALFNGSLTFPKVASSINSLIARCSETPDQKKEREFYTEERLRFFHTLDTQMKKIASNPPTSLDEKNNGDMLKFLLLHRDEKNYQMNRCLQIVSWAGYVLGGALGANFSFTSALNTYHALSELHFSPVAKYLSTVAITFSALPANVKLTAEYFSELLSFAQTNSSLMLKFFPSTVIALGIFLSLIEYPSYSAFFLLSETLAHKYFGDEFSATDILAIALVNSAGIIGYHAKGLIGLILSREPFVEDPVKKDLLLLEKRVTELKGMSNEQYKKGVENLPADFKQAVKNVHHFKLFAERNDDDEKKVEYRYSETLSSKSMSEMSENTAETYKKSKPRENRCAWICSLFGYRSQPKSDSPDESLLAVSRHSIQN